MLSPEQRIASLKSLCEKADKEELATLHMVFLTLMSFYQLADNTTAYLFYRGIESHLINIHKKREAEGKQNYRP